MVILFGNVVHQTDRRITMTETLWHGNDDPPKVGDHIEYILGGEVYEGDYCKGGYISRGTERDRLRMIDNMKDVSQWRLA